MSLARRSWVALAAIAASLAPLRGQALPAPVGEGPLLCLRTDRALAGHRETTLHVVDLAGAGPARPFWRCRSNVEAVRRLDRDHLLLAGYGDPYALFVVDLAAGTHRLLAPGAPHEFVAAHCDDVLHLGDPRDAARDDFFYATPWRTLERRRRLCEQRFDRVMQVAGNLAVCVTPMDRGVWLVSVPRGTGRAVWATPAGADRVRAALSPGGQRLAIGCVEANGKGLLAVVDTGSGAVVQSWPGLPIQVSPLSSSMPTLEVGWHDDAHVVCSETRGDARGTGGSFVHVRRSLVTGEIVDEQAYSGLALAHRAPAQPAPSPAHSGPPPAFTIAVVDGLLRLTRAGGERALAAVPHEPTRRGEIQLAPDAQSAIARLDKDPPEWALFTSGSLVARTIATGPAHGFAWLPRADLAERPGDGRE